MKEALKQTELFWDRRKSDLMIRYCLDADETEPETNVKLQKDVPISFDTKGRKYEYRRVLETMEWIKLETDSNSNEDHDIMNAVLSTTVKK